MLKNRKFSAPILIGLLLIVSSITWLAYALIFDGRFSMAIFTGIVFGSILLLIGITKPKPKE